MQKEDARNTIIFVVLAAAIWIAYEVFILGPSQQRREVAEQRAQAAAQSQVRTPATSAAPRSVYVTRDQAIGGSQRVPIDGPWVRGSLNLRGGRIDDLFLKNYEETTAPNAPNVELLSPEGVRNAFFAELGWTAANVPGLPNADTQWRLASGTRLTPQTPIVLTHDNGQGLVFTRRIAMDERYMFTVTDTVANRSGRPITLAPYGSVQRQGLPEGLGRNQIIHEGGIGVLGDELRLFKYPKWRDREEPATFSSTGGWLGITDKYWLTALIPDQQSAVRATFRVVPSGGVSIFESNFVGSERTLAPGTQTASTTRLFAGAKSVEVLDAYEERLGLPRFDQAVDWGMFWFLTRPIFYALHFFAGIIGNFGLAILLLTVCVKLVFFPLANKSYESISKLKKLQPKMEEIKARHKEDPAKQQQEVMALYQKERINPLMGCLPILVQIPVFYALYKVLFVTLEMRHAPFFGWIDDLSAPDPTSLFNLFGLLPYDPTTVPLIGSFLLLGVWPIIMGFTMWLQTAMNPPAPDPVQQRIFQLFPLIFTFIFAQSPAGLVIYWAWNNLLSIGQQYIIMRKFGVDNPIDGALARLSGRGKAVG